MTKDNTKPPKYLDQSRFPKVVTEGYEKKFKDEYKVNIRLMALAIIKKLNSF